MPLKSGWDSVRTIASPAWFSDYVLTVGALTTQVRPPISACVGRGWASPHPVNASFRWTRVGPGLINAVMSQQGLAPINGTSFAAPFVSGVVALIRSRFPELNAGQVIELITRTAHTPGAGPNEATGYGVVDPIAALTYRVPAANQLPNPDAAQTNRGAAAYRSGQSTCPHHRVVGHRGSCGVGRDSCGVLGGQKASGRANNRRGSPEVIGPPAAPDGQRNSPSCPAQICGSLELRIKRLALRRIDDGGPLQITATERGDTWQNRRPSRRLPRTSAGRWHVLPGCRVKRSAAASILAAGRTRTSRKRTPVSAPTRSSAMQTATGRRSPRSRPQRLTAPQTHRRREAAREPPPKRDRIPVSRAKADSPAESRSQAGPDPGGSTRTGRRGAVQPKADVPPESRPRRVAVRYDRARRLQPDPVPPPQPPRPAPPLTRPRRRRSPMTLRLHRLFVQTNNRSQPSRRRRRATARSIPAGWPRIGRVVVAAERSGRIAVGCYDGVF